MRQVLAVASNSAPQHERKLLEGTGVLFSYTGQKIFHPHAKIININSEGLDTSKILYGVFTNVWEEFLWVTEGSWDSLGFLRIPADSKGLLRILWSQDHGNFRDSVGVCQNPWRFSRILRYSSKSVRRFWSAEPLDQLVLSPTFPFTMVEKKIKFDILG